MTKENTYASILEIKKMPATKVSYTLSERDGRVHGVAGGDFMEKSDAAEVSHLLSIGFLADRLLLALDLHDPDELVASETQLVKDFAGLLDDIIQLTEQPTTLLSGPRTEFAYPPPEFVGLELIYVQQERKQRDLVLQFVRRLRKIVGTLERGESPTAKELTTLKSFLERWADSTLEQVDNRRMRSEAGKSNDNPLKEWQMTLAD